MEIIAVCSARGQNVEFLLSNPVVREVTTGFKRGKNRTNEPTGSVNQELPDRTMTLHNVLVCNRIVALQTKHLSVALRQLINKRQHRKQH